jgi:hypothetical protein
MGEHDDDLEVAESGGHEDVARIAAAVASGLERIATALEHGLHEVAAAIGQATAEPARHRPRR